MKTTDEQHLVTCQPTATGTICELGCPVLLALQIHRLRGKPVAFTETTPRSRLLGDGRAPARAFGGGTAIVIRGPKR